MYLENMVDNGGIVIVMTIGLYSKQYVVFAMMRLLKKLKVRISLVVRK